MTVTYQEGVTTVTLVMTEQEAYALTRFLGNSVPSPTDSGDTDYLKTVAGIWEQLYRAVPLGRPGFSLGV